MTLVDRTTVESDSLPDYDDLPLATRGGRSAWGMFGDNSLGSISLQTPARIRSAAALVKTGKIFPLNATVEEFAHEGWGRKLSEHQLIHQPGGVFFDDLLQNFALQGSSQWDSLGHVGYEPGTFYNGATEDEIASGRRNTIDHWARRGIAGRAVLLDIAATRQAQGRRLDPSGSDAITVDDLEAARKHAGIDYEVGDILLFRTGFATWFASLSVAERTAGTPAPGLAQGEDVCRYLWNNHFSAIACDTLAVEVWPPDYAPEAFPFGAMHNMLIGQLGFALGELWLLDELAADCAADGVYDMFLTSAPINLTGGIGSPANAMVIK